MRPSGDVLGMPRFSAHRSVRSTAGVSNKAGAVQPVSAARLRDQLDGIGADLSGVRWPGDERLSDLLQRSLPQAGESQEEQGISQIGGWVEVRRPIPDVSASYVARWRRGV